MNLGMVLSGDLGQDRIVVTRIAEKSLADWPGPFGDPQRNQFAVPPERSAAPAAMQEWRPSKH